VFITVILYEVPEKETAIQHVLYLATHVENYCYVNEIANEQPADCDISYC